jgi:hypothetical protein
MAQLLEVGGSGGGGGTVAPLQNLVFVGKNGVDAPTQDGSIGKPYLTIAYALSQIPTIGPNAPSPTNRWCVFVAAGRYNEAAINLRADVMIFGTHYMATRIAAASWGLDASFVPAGDHRSGVQNAAISGAATFNFNAIGSNEGKLYFRNVWLQSQMDITAFSSVQQYFFSECLSFAALNVNGGQFITESCNFQASVNFKVGPTLPSSVWIDDHSTYQAGRSIDLTGQGGETYTVQWFGSADAGPTSIVGNVTVQATSDALPALASLTGGAKVVTNDVLIDPTHSLDTTSAGAMRIGPTDATQFQIGKNSSPPGTDPLVLINQGSVQIGGSNAGIQYSTTRANRAQFRGNQFGANNAAPGVTGFKSRGPAIATVPTPPDANYLGVIDGDLLLRLTAIGVAPDNLSTPLAALLTFQVPPGGSVAPNPWVATELELQLVPLAGPVNGATKFFKITSEGVPALRESLARPALPALTGVAAGLAVTGAAGTIVVPNTIVKATSRVTLTIQPGGAAPTGAVWCSAIVPGVSFTIQSIPGDVGVQVYWQVWEPTPA